MPVGVVLGGGEFMPQFQPMGGHGAGLQPSGLMLMGGGVPNDDDEANKKNAWTKEEDEKLCELVAHYGPKKWSTIAQSLGTDRVGKQCRERWHNHLSPAVRKDHWTEEEDKLILEMVHKVGTKWSQIVKMLPGRTDNAIKNRWNSAMRKSLRKQQKATTCVSATPASVGSGDGGQYAGGSVQVLQPQLVASSAVQPRFAPAQLSAHALGQCAGGLAPPGSMPAGLLPLQSAGGQCINPAVAGRVVELLFPNEMSIQLAVDIAVRATCVRLHARTPG